MSGYTKATPGKKIGYMCAIDWEYELENAAGGNKVHPSVEDLLEVHDCAKDCGIVEVEITLKRQVV